MRSRTHTALSSLCVATLAMLSVHSFAPQPAAHTRQRSRYTAISMQLHAVAAPPAEGEKEKRKKDESDNEDWTLSGGGFLPNLTRARRRSTNIQNVMTIEEYKKVVVDEDERIVVVRFFAPWCRACKAIEPKFEKLAFEYSPSVKFVQVPLTKENAFLHDGLGVPSLPFGHIYHPDVGLCEERSLNKRIFHDFRHALETYVDGSCDLPEDDFM